MKNTYNKPTIQHLLDFQALDKQGVLYLLNLAQSFIPQLENTTLDIQTFPQTTMINLFYEPSTRTQHSFNIAAQKLAIHALNPNMLTLSDKKGESLLDTIQTLEAMSVKLFVIRHPDNHAPHFIASELNSQAHVINAGDGNNHHPTQTLIDLLTIYQAKQRLTDLTISIVGDIAHSRVAHSFISAASLLDLGTIKLIGPQNLLPTQLPDNLVIQQYNNLEQGLADADVVMALRIQKERIGDNDLPNKDEFISAYGLNEDSIQFAKKDAIVLHPGPMVRGIEINSSIADGPQSRILQQVKNSTPVRMAVIQTILN